MKVTSSYTGEVRTPEGKKYTFNIKGASQAEIKGLLSHAQPGAKIKMHRKAAKKTAKKK